MITAYQPPAVRNACRLSVRVDLQESVFVRVAVGHKWVVVVDAIGAVVVAFAITWVVCEQAACHVGLQARKSSHETRLQDSAGRTVKDTCGGIPKLRNPGTRVGACPLLLIVL